MNAQTSKKRIPKNLPAIVFLILLAAVSVLNLCIPDSEMSADENRMLAQPPELSFGSLFIDEDKWTLDFEEYITDQFPLRSLFVKLKATSERAMLKHETGGVYFAREGALIERPRRAAFDTVAINVSAVNDFARQLDIPVTLALIPNSVCVDSRLLPPFAYDGEQTALIDASYASASVECADVASALYGSGLFYRTDHHINSDGAYRVYTALSDSLDFVPHPSGDFEKRTVTENFHGTAAAFSGAWWIKPDSIELYSLPGERLSLTTSENGEVYMKDTLYDMDMLATPDEYAVFLGGNHPVQVICGGAGESLLIIKDSFAHCVAPLLAGHFEKLHLIDMRYYRGSVLRYAEENDIDRVLVMYSVDNFSGEKNLVFLGNS